MDANEKGKAVFMVNSKSGPSFKKGCNENGISGENCGRGELNESTVCGRHTSPSGAVRAKMGTE